MTWQSPGNIVQSKVQLSEEKQVLLAELANTSEYWSKAQDFTKQVNGRELSSMTDRQVDWYHSIDAGFDRELQLKEAKDAFGEYAEQAKHTFDELYPRRGR